MKTYVRSHLTTATAGQQLVCVTGWRPRSECEGRLVESAPGSVESMAQPVPKTTSPGAVLEQDQGAMSEQLLSSIMLGLVTIGLLAGYVLLAVSGRDTVPYLVFASGPTVTAIVGALLARRTATISTDLAAVRHQTNSLLTTELAAASIERQDLAAQTRAAVTAATIMPHSGS